MRSHGWAGNTPASDEEAIERILDAADKVIGERHIGDADRRCGADARCDATDRLPLLSRHGGVATHVKGITDPVVAVIEGVAYAVEQLAADNQVEFVLSQRRRGG